MRKKTLHGLGALQAKIMELVWERNEATVADIVEHLGRHRAITYTTVLAAMQKLEKKGWLTHRAAGRAYVYRPLKSREKAQAGLVTEMLDAVFDGDPKLLMSQLLDARCWSAAELTQMRQLIEARRKQNHKE